MSVSKGITIVNEDYLVNNELFEKLFALPEGYTSIDFFWGTTFELQPQMIPAILLNMIAAEKKILISQTDAIAPETFLLELHNAIKNKEWMNRIKVHYGVLVHDFPTKNTADYLNLANKMVEKSCYQHVVDGACFHPKVYLVKFGTRKGSEEKSKYRLIICSKNLTDSRPFNVGMFFESDDKQDTNTETGQPLNKFIQYIEKQCGEKKSWAVKMNDISKLSFKAEDLGDTNNTSHPLTIENLKFHFQHPGDGGKSIGQEMCQDFHAVSPTKGTVYIKSSDISIDNQGKFATNFSCANSGQSIKLHVCGNKDTFYNDFINHGGKTKDGIIVEYPIGWRQNNDPKKPRFQIHVATKQNLHSKNKHFHSRIHCKIYEYPYTDTLNNGMVKCWLGSANFTKAGLGLSTSSKFNNIEAMVSFDYCEANYNEKKFEKEFIHYYHQLVYISNELKEFNKEDVQAHEIQEAIKKLKIKLVSLQDDSSVYKVKFEVSTDHTFSLSANNIIYLALGDDKKIIKELRLNQGQNSITLEFENVGKKYLPFMGVVYLYIKTNILSPPHIMPVVYKTEPNISLNEIWTNCKASILVKEVLSQREIKLIHCIPASGIKGLYNSSDSVRLRVSKYLFAKPEQVEENEYGMKALNNIDAALDALKGLDGKIMGINKKKAKDFIKFRGWMKNTLSLRHLNTPSTNVYLIADEVGLGKTRIAKAVLDGMALSHGGLKAMYIASNERIARQNLKGDFQGKPEACTYGDNLAMFQKATVNHVLGVLGYKDIDSIKNEMSAEKEEVSVCFDYYSRSSRLSELYKPNITGEKDEKDCGDTLPEPTINNQTNSTNSSPFIVVGLTPATTFTNMGSPTGRESEREYIKNVLENYLKPASVGTTHNFGQYIPYLKMSLKNEWELNCESINDLIEEFKEKALKRCNSCMNTTGTRRKRKNYTSEFDKSIETIIGKCLAKYNMDDKMKGLLTNHLINLKLSLRDSFPNDKYDWEKVVPTSNDIRKKLVTFIERIRNSSRDFIENQDYQKEYEEWLIEKYLEGLKQFNNNEKESFKKIFSKFRRIMNDMNILAYDPDIIVLDEFQRFRELLDKHEGNKGYKMLDMINMLNKQREKTERPKIKLLLLSATPYKINKALLAKQANESSSIEDSLDMCEMGETDDNNKATPTNNSHSSLANKDDISNSDDGEEVEYGEDNPFGDFDSLRKFINELNGRDIEYGKDAEEIYQGVLCRTERRDFYTEEDQEKVVVEKSYHDINTALLEAERDNIMHTAESLKRLKENWPEKNTDGFMKAFNSYNEEAPEFYLFASRYKSITGFKASETVNPEQNCFVKNLNKKAGNLKIKIKDDYLEIDPSVIQGHLRTRLLIENALPDGMEKRLWLPPSVDNEEGLGKTLVFAHYVLSTRAIAVVVSAVAEQRLRKRLQDFSMNFNPQQHASVDPQTLIEYIGNMGWIINLGLEEKEKEDFIGAIAGGLTRFFSTSYAKLALLVHVIESNEQYEEKQQNEIETPGLTCDHIVEYCKKYALAKVLEEYFITSGESAEVFKDGILKVFDGLQDGKRTRVQIMPAYYDAYQSKSKQKKSQSNKFVCSMGERYTKDRYDNNSHKNEHEDNIREIFNSPFYPFVLAITSSGQEGLNLHKYSNQLMHWSASPSTDGFEQREGRIDRPNSLSNRLKIVALYKEIKNGNLCSYAEVLNAVNEHYGKNSNTNTHLDDSLIDSGIFPSWYVPVPSKQDNNVHYKRKRIICTSNYDNITDDYEVLKKALKEYPSFGVEENITLCPYLKRSTRDKK